MFRFAFLFLACLGTLFSEEESQADSVFESSLVKTQHLLSTFVNSVSAVSGDWMQSETDFVVLGPEPLILNRYYIGDHSLNKKLGYNWTFNHPRQLIIDLQEKDVTDAKSTARLQQPSGIATIHETIIDKHNERDEFVPLFLSKTDGLTNCMGEISARTNLHNTIIKYDLKARHCIATTGNGSLTYYQFTHRKDLSEWHQGIIGTGYYKLRHLNHFVPKYEKKPNGNTVHYHNGKIYSSNASGASSFGEITFQDVNEKVLKVEASDGKWATYKFVMFNHPIVNRSGMILAYQRHPFFLAEATFSHKPTETYEYSHGPPATPQELKNPLLVAKRKPNGRFQKVHYYRKGVNILAMGDRGKRTITIDHSDDFRCHRVKAILEPVGFDKSPIATHQFIYEGGNGEKRIKKKDKGYSGRTKVYDAYLRKTIYEYNKEHRPTSIQRFGLNNRCYSQECFTWDDHYSFPAELPTLHFEENNNLAKSIQSSILSQLPDFSDPEQMEKLIKACLKSSIFQRGGKGNLLGKYLKDTHGHILYAHFFDYDRRGNIKRERLIGNLSGNNEKTIALNAHRKPINNGAEAYEKRFTYSKDRWNLLKSEEEDNGKGIEYHYHPESDLLAAKYIQDHGKTILRQFFHYDQHATLIQVIKDDGYSKEEEDLSGVTERHMTLITPRQAAPLGLPECVKQTYLDLHTGKETLLKKTIYAYSREGHLLQQDCYDASDSFCYSLFWDYDSHGNLIKQVNALGEEVIKEYDENDNLIVERGPRPGDAKEYTYDFSNRLIATQTRADGEEWSEHTTYDYIGNRVAERDRYGNEVLYRYDDFNRLISTVYPDGSETKKGYDCLDHLTLETDARGFSTVKKYNIRGKETSILMPDGQCESFLYALDGTLAEKTTSNGTTLYYTYDCLGRVLTETGRDQAGHFLYEISNKYNGFHQIESTDAEGVTTSFIYDGAGRISETYCLDKRVSYEYDSLGRQSKKIEWIGTERQRISCSEYDFLDRITEERIEDETGEVFKKMRYRYDLLGNRSHIIAYTAAGESIRQTDYTLDQKPVRMIDPEGNVFHIVYKEVQNRLGQTVLQTLGTDPLGRQTIITYDVKERPAHIKKINHFGLLLSEQDLEYDRSGNLICQIDHLIISGEIKDSIALHFTYQETNQLSSIVQAAGRPEQKITTIQYNQAGQKEQEFKTDGVILTSGYDALGRLETYSSNDRTIDYHYQYNLRHQIIAVTDRISNRTTTCIYNASGQLTQEILATNIPLAYHYDQLDRVTEIILPDGSNIHYDYNAEYLSQVNRMTPYGVQYTHRYDHYDQAGSLLESTIANNSRCNFNYQLQKKPHHLKTLHYNQTDFEYDAAGRLCKTSVQDSLGKRNLFYTYDEHDHLIQEEGRTYSCDSLHHRLSKNQVPHLSNCLHQLVSNGDETFNYDLAGNLKSRQKGNQQTKYKYDALNRLIFVQTGSNITRYFYDPFNRRIAKAHDNQKMYYLYAGQNEIGAQGVSGKIEELRILGHGCGAEIGAAVAIELGEKILIPTHDFHGNIVTLSDLSGSLLQTSRYTAFGEVKHYSENGTELASALSPWQFSSKRLDPETGFLNFGRRYYDPVNAIWTTTDPAGLVDGPNLYAYLHHQPLQSFDLYGLEEVTTPLHDLETHEKSPNLSEQKPQEAPLGFIEKKKDKKDKMFFCGLHQFSEIGISWVNGIMNNLKDSSAAARALSEMASDHFVTFVYNKGKTIVTDLVRCFFEFSFYMETDAVKNLQTKWDAYFRSVSVYAYLIHFCHSEGAIITRNALMNYPEELRKRIIVIAVAPGAYIEKKYAYQVTHYVSKRDIVPMIDFMGAWRCRDSIVRLDPHIDAPIFDHSFNSPTYRDSLESQVANYMGKF